MSTYYKYYYDAYFEKFIFIKLPDNYIFKSNETYYLVRQTII